MPVHVLLLTDDTDPESVLPNLRLVAAVRYAALNRSESWSLPGVDVAVVDGRCDPLVAAQACRTLTGIAPHAAVVVLVSAEDAVVVDLAWGFDDMVLTTASIAELHTRLRLAMQRRRRVASGTFRFGDLVLRPESYTAVLAGRDLHLTLTEFRLLNFLVRHSGRAFTRTRLMDELWQVRRSRRTVDVHVQRLRAKLGTEHESMVDTVRGVGYMAASDADPLLPIALAR